MDDEPLVVPADDPLCLPEDLTIGVARAELGLDVVDHLVVEAEQRAVKLGDDQVLVVAGIADERGVLTVAGHVEPSFAVDRHRPRTRYLLQEEGRSSPVDRRVVEMRRSARARFPVHAVQVERGDPEVADGLRILLASQARRRVEGHVVIEELAEEGEARGDRRVVRVVDALRGVGDQDDRVGQIVGSVHRAVLGSELGEPVPHQLRVLGENRKSREQPAESALIVEDGSRSGLSEPGVTVGHDGAPPSRGLTVPRLYIRRSLIDWRLPRP